MIFDSRIKSEDDIFHYFNRKNAAQFIGKPGYFADYLDYFDDLDARGPKVLTEINDESGCFFSDETNISGYSYFIPEDALKPEEPEKKYRPYSLEEFFNIFKVGDLIVFRMKTYDEIKCAMFTGYITDDKRIDDKTPGACEVMLGIFHYSLLDLFKDFELLYRGEWLPFGVIDE